MSIIDIILIVIILLFSVLGVITGFFKTVSRFVIYVVSALLAKIFSEPVSAAVYNRFLKDTLIDTLKSNLPQSFTETDWAQVFTSVVNSIPENVVKIAQFLHIMPDESVGQTIQTALSVENIEQSVIMPVVTRVLLIVVGLVLFSVTAVILRLIFTLIDKRFFENKHNALTTTNRILGFAVGIVRGAIPAAIVCFLFVLVVPLTDNAYLCQALEDSYFCTLVTKLIY